MVLDCHGANHYRGHCYRSRGWDLASRRTKVAWIIYSNEVRMLNRSGFLLAYLYSRPVPTSSPNLTSAIQYFLNDTSLAALILPSGARQLFFQDNNGIIRGAIRSASKNQWTISPDLNLSSNSKRNTPLAATIYDEPAAYHNGVNDANAANNANGVNNLNGVNDASSTTVNI